MAMPANKRPMYIVPGSAQRVANRVGAVDPQVQSCNHFESAMTVMKAMTSHATNLAPMRTSVPDVRKEVTGHTAVTEGSVTRYGSQDMVNGTIDLTVIRILCLLTDTMRTVRVVEAIAGMIRRVVGNKVVAVGLALGDVVHRWVEAGEEEAEEGDELTTTDTSQRTWHVPVPSKTSRYIRYASDCATDLLGRANVKCVKLVLLNFVLSLLTGVTKRF